MFTQNLVEFIFRILLKLQNKVNVVAGLVVNYNLKSFFRKYIFHNTLLSVYRRVHSLLAFYC